MGWPGKNHAKILFLDTFFHFSRFSTFGVFGKIKKNTSPCRKILSFCRQCCTIFMRIPEKNLVKIRSLGPKTELMFPSRFGLLCAGVSRNTHTWLIHQLGLVSPTVGTTWWWLPSVPVDWLGGEKMWTCYVKLWHAGEIFVVWLISRLVSIIKGVWLPTVRGEGAIMSGLRPAGGNVMALSSSLLLILGGLWKLCGFLMEQGPPPRSWGCLGGAWRVGI